MHNRTVEHGPGRDKPVVNAAEACEDFSTASSSPSITTVCTFQLLLGLDQFLLGAAGDRDNRAFKESLVDGYPLAFSSGMIARLDVLCAGHSPTPAGS